MKKESQLIADELRQAIQEAEQGMLSPYWQQYYTRMLDEIRGTDEFPEEGETLARQLRETVQAHTQISDAEQARRELQQQGSELLFYRSADYGTLLEIVYTPDKGCFTYAVEIDSSLPKDKQKQRAWELREALRKWAKLSGVEMDWEGYRMEHTKNRRASTLNMVLYGIEYELGNYIAERIIFRNLIGRANV